MSAEKPDWIKYRDSTLEIQIPKYLRQQRSMMFFKAPKKRKANQNLIMLAMESLKDSDSIAGAKAAIEVFKPGIARRMGVEWILLRRGSPAWLDNGLELLTDMRNLSTGHKDHDMTMVIDKDGLCLDIRVIGDGDLGIFEKTVRTIIQSLRRQK